MFLLFIQIKEFLPLLYDGCRKPTRSSSLAWMLAGGPAPTHYKKVACYRMLHRASDLDG